MKRAMVRKMVEHRALYECYYMYRTKKTLVETAKDLNMNFRTLWDDIQRVKDIDSELYAELCIIMKQHKTGTAERMREIKKSYRSGKLIESNIENVDNVESRRDLVETFEELLVNWD